MLRASGVVAHPAPRHHPNPAAPAQRHDARHHLSPHTACRGTTLPALHRCRPTVSKGTRHIPDQAKTNPSTTAPATQSPLRSSLGRRPGQSAHLPPKPPHRQIPIVVNRQPGGPRVPSWEAFGRRPSERVRPATTGPASETLHRNRHAPRKGIWPR